VGKASLKRNLKEMNRSKRKEEKERNMKRNRREINRVMARVIREEKIRKLKGTQLQGKRRKKGQKIRDKVHRGKVLLGLYKAIPWAVHPTLLVEKKTVLMTRKGVREIVKSVDRKTFKLQLKTPIAQSNYLKHKK